MDQWCHVCMEPMFFPSTLVVSVPVMTDKGIMARLFTLPVHKGGAGHLYMTCAQAVDCAQLYYRMNFYKGTLEKFIIEQNLDPYNHESNIVFMANRLINQQNGPHRDHGREKQKLNVKRLIDLYLDTFRSKPNLAYAALPKLRSGRCGICDKVHRTLYAQLKIRVDTQVGGIHLNVCTDCAYETFLAVEQWHTMPAREQDALQTYGVHYDNYRMLSLIRGHIAEIGSDIAFLHRRQLDRAYGKISSITGGFDE